jgi:hypothetical protein
MDNQRVIKINEKDYSYNNSKSFSYKFEDNTQTKTNITLKGWLAEKGKEITRRQCYIVLKNQATGTCLQLPTKSVKENNAKAFFNDGLKYNYAGFSTVVQINKLEPKATYKVLFLNENNGKMELYETDQTVTVE